MAKILVTGAAGFIGYHVAHRLLARGDSVVGLDNLNAYYEVSLKEARLDRLRRSAQFHFVRADLADRAAMERVFAQGDVDRVVHLAAQAGVRYSLTDPHTYAMSNLVGFLHMLEGCRQHDIRHLVFASSSSVYGANTAMPFSVQHVVDHPVSLYAATKKANELMAHTYSHLYRIPTTGLRFFTVYGPWGRPDMAIFLFTRAILSGRPIEVFNYGRMRRDFTYIDDVAEAVVRVLDTIPEPDPDWSASAPNPATSNAPYRLYNVGNNNPVELTELIELLERNLGREAIKELRELQPGDVMATYADVSDLERDVGFRPSTPIEDGVRQFVDWYRDYYALAPARLFPAT
jgi:UDP-glucuronate 4-epimerase